MASIDSLREVLGEVAGLLVACFGQLRISDTLAQLAPYW